MSTPNSTRSRSLVRSLLPLWIILAILAILSPIGLLAQGTAWGEWGGEELQQMLHEAGISEIPAGMQQFETIWNAPLPAYGIHGFGNATIGYIASAVIGILLIVLVTFVLGRTLARKDEADTDV